MNTRRNTRIRRKVVASAFFRMGRGMEILKLWEARISHGAARCDLPPGLLNRTHQGVALQRTKENASCSALPLSSGSPWRWRAHS